MQMKVNPYCPRVFATAAKDGTVKVWHFVQGNAEPALSLDEILKMDQAELDSKYPVTAPDKSSVDYIIEQDLCMDPYFY